jgi:hypothetical protein
MIQKQVAIFLLILACYYCNGQGFNHTFLLGYDTGLFDTNVVSTKARLDYTLNSISVIPETRKLAFRASQSNISDSAGNLLMATNGCWIANALGDTMLNGNGLNPNSFTNDWCDSNSGLPYSQSNIIIPTPDDSSKYYLFHLTGNYNINAKASELYYSLIDMSLDNGLGGIVSGKKNQIIIQDTLLTIMDATRHANGRDWWIVCLQANTDSIYKILLTPIGVESITTQSLGVGVPTFATGQCKFSPDGTKFAYYNRVFAPGGSPVTNEIRYFDFDRCMGAFANSSIISFTDQYQGLGLAFSANSKYLYFATFLKILQINTDTSDMQSSLQTVALNDTFYSPNYPFLTNFWFMYLAANGKIYITSGNSVIDIHYIDNPDSGGMACNVMQHALHLPCYSARGNVNHPNYYLGRLQGSPCDTLQWTVISETEHDFRFRIYPNPITSNSLHIGYLLPQNKKGVFEIYNVTGQGCLQTKLAAMEYPEQNISLQNLSEWNLQRNNNFRQQASEQNNCNNE